MAKKEGTMDFETDPIEETMDDIMEPKPNNNRLLYKVPPHSLEAEIAILRIMLLKGKNIRKVKRRLSAGGEEFYREAHWIIYTTILKLFKQGQPVDLIILTAELRKNSQLDRVGGTNYLEKIFLKEPPSIEKDGYSPDNLGAYLDLLEELSWLRQLIYETSKLAEIAFQGNIKKLERPLKQMIKEARKALQFISLSK